jgi:hypothetical protein
MITKPIKQADCHWNRRSLLGVFFCISCFELPKGFMRIRHYGYLSNAIKKSALEKIKRQSDERKDQTTE